jgi:hypothetical protein
MIDRNNFTVSQFIENEFYNFNTIEIYGFFDIVTRYMNDNSIYGYEKMLDLKINDIFDQKYLEEKLKILFDEVNYSELVGTEIKKKKKKYARDFNFERIKDFKKGGKYTYRQSLSVFNSTDRRFKYSNSYTNKNKFKFYSNLYSNTTEYKLYNFYIEKGKKKIYQTQHFFPIFKKMENYYNYNLLMRELSLQNGNNFNRNFEQKIKINFKEDFKEDSKKNKSYLYKINNELEKYNFIKKIFSFREYCNDSLLEEILECQWYKLSYGNRDFKIEMVNTNKSLNSYFLKDYKNELINSINNIINPKIESDDILSIDSYINSFISFLDKNDIYQLKDVVNKIYQKNIIIKNNINFYKWFMLEKRNYMNEDSYEKVKKFAGKINKNCYFLAKKILSNKNLIDKEEVEFKKRYYLKIIKKLLDNSNSFPEFIYSLTNFSVRYSDKLRYSTIYSGEHLDMLLQNNFFNENFEEFKIYFSIFLWVDDIELYNEQKNLTEDKEEIIF